MIAYLTIIKFENHDRSLGRLLQVSGLRVRVGVEGG